MKVIEKILKEKEKEYCIIIMQLCTMETGKMIYQKEKEILFS